MQNQRLFALASTPKEPESNDYKLMNESSGEGYCPYQESQDVTTLYAGKFNSRIFVRPLSKWI